MPARPNMIQMCMRKANRLHLIAVVLEIFDVWNQVIHPRIVLARKQHPHIHDNHLGLIFDNRHIFADSKLAYAPNRNNSHRLWVRPQLF